MWYSRRPTQLLRQAVGDLLALGWTVLWISVGRLVYGLVDALITPTRALGDAGRQYQVSVEDASRRVTDVPVIGTQIADALRSVATPGDAVSQRAQEAMDTLHQLAWALGLTTSLTPIVLVVGPWLLLRWRFAARARTARRLAGSPAGIELLALRALARRPMSQLLAGELDAVGGWRRGDPGAIRQLANLELHACGLRQLGDVPTGTHSRR